MPLNAFPHILNDGYYPTALVAMENEFLSRWLPQHNVPSQRLFHYTSSPGTQGILRDRALWLSDVMSFNDPDEIEYGRRIVLSSLNECEAQEVYPPVQIFLSGMRSFIESFGANQHGVFAVCFCEDGNLLSQWREYADQARGYCLGFDFSTNTHAALEMSDLAKTKELYFRKVIYCKQQQRNWVDSYLQSAIKAVRSAQPASQEAYSIGFSAVNILFEMLICFKHAAFTAESEWRLFRVTRGDHEREGLRFRNSGGLIVPYRPLILYKSKEDETAMFPLRSITCGPALEFERARSGLNQLLRHLSIDGSPIGLPRDIEIKEPEYSLRHRLV